MRHQSILPTLLFIGGLGVGLAHGGIGLAYAQGLKNVQDVQNLRSAQKPIIEDGRITVDLSVIDKFAPPKAAPNTSDDALLPLPPAARSPQEDLRVMGTWDYQAAKKDQAAARQEQLNYIQSFGERRHQLEDDGSLIYEQRRSLDALRSKYFPMEAKSARQKAIHNQVAALIMAGYKSIREEDRQARLNVPAPVKPPKRPTKITNKVETGQKAIKQVSSNRRHIPISRMQQDLTISPKQINKPVAAATVYKKLVSIAYPDQEKHLQDNVKGALLDKYLPRLQSGNVKKVALYSFWSAPSSDASSSHAPSKMAYNRAQALKSFLQQNGLPNMPINIVPKQTSGSQNAFSDWIDIMVSAQ